MLIKRSKPKITGVSIRPPILMFQLLFVSSSLEARSYIKLFDGCNCVFRGQIGEIRIESAIEFFFESP
jgi:hypothetical protein